MQSMRCITPSVRRTRPAHVMAAPLGAMDGRSRPGALLHVQRSASGRAAWSREQP